MSEVVMSDRHFVTAVRKSKGIYAPGRIPLKAAKNFVVKNTTAIRSFAEYVAPGEIGSLDELKPGHGAIVRRGLEKIAAYRDSDSGLASQLRILQPCRLSPALQQFRDLLGLLLSWLDVQR